MGFHRLHLHSLLSDDLLGVTSGMGFWLWNLDGFVVFVPAVDFWFGVSEMLWVLRCCRWSGNFFGFVLLGECVFFAFGFFRGWLETVLI